MKIANVLGKLNRLRWAAKQAMECWKRTQHSPESGSEMLIVSALIVGELVHVGNILLGFLPCEFNASPQHICQTVRPVFRNRGSFWDAG